MDSNMLKQIYYTLINFSLFELRYHCLGLYQQTRLVCLRQFKQNKGLLGIFFTRPRESAVP